MMSIEKRLDVLSDHYSALSCDQCRCALMAAKNFQRDRRHEPHPHVWTHKHTRTQREDKERQTTSHWRERQEREDTP